MVSTDKKSYAPGELVTLTVTGANTEHTVTVTAESGGQSAVTQYAVTAAPVTVTDSDGGSWTQVSPSVFTSPASGNTPSGFSGVEPSAAALTASGITALTWSGYTWENENWGTATGQPKSSQVSTVASGSITLTASDVNGQLFGAELDSARGDAGIAGNASTWGYGTYRWVIGTDLSALAPGLTLGMFTFWSASKGGPAGQKEVDIEFTALPGEPVVVQLGFYADNATGITSAVPPYHVLTSGSQVPVKSSPVTTVEFTWLPDSITWQLWYSASTSTPSDIIHMVTQGEAYQFTEPYGGNNFSGVVNIPATGKQQVIMNLWASGQPAAGVNQQVNVESFTYTPA